MEFTNETKLELGKYKITCDDGMMYQLTVDTDMYPTDPREDEGNLGTMLCFSDYRCYGDCNSNADAEEQVVALCRKYGKSDEEIEEMTFYEAMNSIGITFYKAMNFIAEHDDILVLPLYILDHSGLSMATYRQDAWDSSYTGFIYVEKDFFLEACPIKDTERWKEYAKKTLLAEIETYSAYLEGSVYAWDVVEYVKVTREDLKGVKISVTYEPSIDAPEYVHGDRYDLPTIQDIKDEIGEFTSVEEL